MQSKILIIEDDHAITHLLDVALTLDYYNVTTAENATQAHFKIQIDKPDVILLDLGLPDKDGLCLISEIRQHTDIPIIVISARQEEQTIIQALDNGANDYMTKPLMLMSFGHEFESSKESLSHIKKLTLYLLTVC